MSRVETPKVKWEMTIDAMLIIGRYFQSNNDFINSMKVCKRYNELVRMYHFNPISEWELFENIETQYLYKPEDEKKQGMYQYVYWYRPNKVLETNEIIKYDPFKYVLNNMDKLKE